MTFASDSIPISKAATVLLFVNTGEKGYFPRPSTLSPNKIWHITVFAATVISAISSLPVSACNLSISIFKVLTILFCSLKSPSTFSMVYAILLITSNPNAICEFISDAFAIIAALLKSISSIATVVVPISIAIPYL